MKRVENEPLTFKQWKESLPKCIGFEGGCDGDLVATEHEPKCPMFGKKWATHKDAWDARQPEVSALTAERDALKRELAAESKQNAMAGISISAAIQRAELAERKLEVAQAACAKVRASVECHTGRLCLMLNGIVVAVEGDDCRDAIFDQRRWDEATLKEAAKKINANPGAPLIDELTNLREVVEVGDALALEMQLHPFQVPSVLVALAAYLAAKFALEVKG